MVDQMKYVQAAFDHLVMDEKHKRLIKALITAPRDDGTKILQDVIQHKSGGVAILLEVIGRRL
jgi:hypothetical protein